MIDAMFQIAAGMRANALKHGQEIEDLLKELKQLLLKDYLSLMIQWKERGQKPALKKRFMLKYKFRRIELRMRKIQIKLLYLKILSKILYTVAQIMQIILMNRW